MMRIEVNGQKIYPWVPTLFLLPEEPLVIRIQTPNSQLSGSRGGSRSKTGSWSVLFNGYPMKFDGNDCFSGIAPKDPGFYSLIIESRPLSNQDSDSPNLNQETGKVKPESALLVIVLHPFSRIKGGFLYQFPMGSYPDPKDAPEKVIPKAFRSAYLPPKGFIEVNASNRDVFLSQHYRLQDFISPLHVPFPQFIALSPALLQKLEWITLYLKHYTQNLGARLTILSGFRSPRYNQTVSGALWSRHIYGDAADLIVDLSPQNGLRDDLNRDGRIDRDDVLVLAKFIEEIDNKTGLWGGMGIFDRGEHGPSIHIDTRGFKARW
jgi:hypothetical protein